MKYLFTFLGGACFMSACVVASNSQLGWMFLFGAIMASCVILVSRRYSFLLRQSGSEMRRGGAVAVGSGTGTTASVCAGVGVDDDTLHMRQLRTRSTDSPHATGSRWESARQFHSRERLRTSTREPKARRAPCKTNKKEVQFRMLRPIQQDILSALVNLKVPYSDAYNVALANTSASFDEAFRVAIASLGGLTKERFEESRRAAA